MIFRSFAISMVIVCASALSLDAEEYPRSELVVTTEWLARNYEAPGVRVVDTRTQGYEEAHIPGAVHLDISTSRDAANPPSYLPDLDRFAAKLGSLGIDRNTHIVFYDDRGGIYGTRPWVVLQLLGHPRASIVNGGWDKWVGESRPISSDTVSVPARRYKRRQDVEISDWVVTAEEVVAAIDDGETQIVDSRTVQESNGSDLGSNPRGGAIPGSVPLFWEEVLSSADGVRTLKTPEELRELFDSHGIESRSPVITYCQGGGRAAHELFVMHLMGYD